MDLSDITDSELAQASLLREYLEQSRNNEDLKNFLVKTIKIIMLNQLERAREKTAGS